MLSFSFSNILTHKKPKVFIGTVTEDPPSEMYVVDNNGETIRNPIAPPIVLFKSVTDIDFNSALVNWNVFVPPDSKSHCEIRVYEYSETDAYNDSLLKYSQDVPFVGDSNLNSLVSDLDETTIYRVRIRAVAVTEEQTLAGDWIEGGFTTTPVPTNFNGAYHGAYYINGVKTTLSASGEGVWNNVSYINGVAINLEYIECLSMSRVGYWFGKFTVDFVIYDGEFACTCCTEVEKNLYRGYYVNGRRRPSDWSGYGFVQSYASATPWLSNAYGYSYANIPYSNVPTYYAASAPFTGYANGKYYVDGVESPFDLNGVGSISVGGTTYNFVNGTPVSGYRNGFYYIGGVETPLSPNGTGTWNGKIYNNGSFVSLVNTPYTWQQGAINGNEYYYPSSFGSGITYG
jgi:hypothetical protein